MPVERAVDADRIRSSEPAAAVTASAADSQYAVAPGPITRLRAGPAAIRVVTEVAIAITHSRQLLARLAPPRDGQVGA